jgi:hypothetical protein
MKNKERGTATSFSTIFQLRYLPDTSNLTRC